MKEILINQLVRFEFSNKRLFVKHTALIKSKSCINSIICYRTVDDIIVMCETYLGSICHNKIQPVFRRIIENQRLDFVKNLNIKIIDIDKSPLGSIFFHPSAHPGFSLFKRSSSIKSVSIVQRAIWNTDFRNLNYFQTSVIQFHIICFF